MTARWLQIYSSPEFAEYINAMWNEKLVPWILADYITPSHQTLPEGNGVEDKIASVLWCFCNGESPEQSFELLYNPPTAQRIWQPCLVRYCRSWYGAPQMEILCSDKVSLGLYADIKAVCRGLLDLPNQLDD